MQMKNNERGSARAKLIIFIVIFAILGYVGYLYIPVAIDAYYFKDTMQNTVNLAVTQGYDTAWVTDQLKKGGREYHVPRMPLSHRPREITGSKHGSSLLVRSQPRYTLTITISITRREAQLF